MPRVSPLQLRKELLIAESELNRAHLIEDWCAMTVGVHTLTTRLKSISILAAAALVVSAISGYRRERAANAGAHASWIDMALKAVKVAGPIWLAFRSPGREPSEK